MAVGALGLELLMDPVFLNLKYKDITKWEHDMSGDLPHLVGHLSRVLRACKVILAENHEDVFINNTSES